jgi:RPA family protein
MQARQIAHRVTIAQLKSGKYVTQEGWLPNYVDIGDKQVSRVVVEGKIQTQIILVANTPVQVNAQLLQDSDQILIRSFDTIQCAKDIDDGDLVRIIGRVRQYQEQIFIVPEIIRKISKVVERKHLTPPVVQKEPVVEKKIFAIEDILALIDSLDTGNGAPKGKIVEELERKGVEQAQKRIHNLLLAGDLFEMKPDMIKVLK